MTTFKNPILKSALLLALLLALVVSAAVLSGCTEQLVAKDGEYSCVDCHTDRELLRASLEADPPPVKEEAESEGEG